MAEDKLKQTELDDEQLDEVSGGSSTRGTGTSQIKSTSLYRNPVK